MANILVAEPHSPIDNTSLVRLCPFFNQQQSRPLVYAKTREDESLRQALKLIKPIRDDFRLADYSESFNWTEISEEFHNQLDNHKDLPHRLQDNRDWYAVVFRSKRRVNCNNVDLFEADRLAYEEAFNATNGSLLVYWYTGLDEDNNCLATCVWSSQDIARSVNSLPMHKNAVRLSAGSYAHYHIDRYRIEWVEQEGRLAVRPWNVK